MKKFDRYALFCWNWIKSPGTYLNANIIICMSVRQHFPIGLRQWAADQILLRVVQIEYGVTA
jgi:hypothetical protein